MFHLNFIRISLFSGLDYYAKLKYNVFMCIQLIWFFQVYLSTKLIIVCGLNQKLGKR